MRPFNKVVLATLLAATLCGCTEYDVRRDTIGPSAGNALASDAATQIIDPWPRDSANHNIAYNGEKMQSAIERYRTNQVIPPHGTGTSTTYQPQPAASTAAGNNNTPVGQTVTQSAAAAAH